MQNKPNLLNAEMNVSQAYTKDYENERLRRHWKNKANTNPIKPKSNPISFKAKMKLSFYSARDYENKPRLRPPAKQTQSKPIPNPIKAKTNPISKAEPTELNTENAKHRKY